jgi:hypothetical protein
VIDVSQVKYAAFRDPDGNNWLLQQFPRALQQPGQNLYQAETNTGEDVAERARAALRPRGRWPPSGEPSAPTHGGGDAF